MTIIFCLIGLALVLVTSFRMRRRFFILMLLRRKLMVFRDQVTTFLAPILSKISPSSKFIGPPSGIAWIASMKQELNYKEIRPGYSLTYGPFPLHDQIPLPAFSVSVK
jgi:hypothetical protein